jgi:general secretion pathway protein J
MTRFKNAEGFSLAELLVALALLGMISALIASGLGLGNKIWNRSEEKAQATRSRYEAEAGLSHLLAALQPLRQGGARLIDFKGSPDVLEGVVALPPHVGLGGLYRLRLFLDPRAHQLALSLAAYGKDLESSGERTSLAEAAGALQIRYFGKAGGSTQEEWHASWQNEDRLPALLSLKIMFLGRELEWPEFKIATRLDEASWQ